MRSYCTTPLKAACLLLVLFFTNQLNSQPILGFSSATGGLSSPVDIVAEPGSNRLFIVQQGGSIRIFDGSALLGTPFLTISTGIVTGGERGLLSMAFHPDYLSNRYFFVYYNNSAGDITIARYRRDVSDADIADPLSRIVLLNIPKSFTNHNGGKLNFGTDGMLYFGTGDGGSGDDPEENGQDGNSLLGKMLRLDVDAFATSAPFYDIPADNPFTGDAGVRDEIFAMGLRNPWRWSFDKSNGDLWIADVGQGAWEEVNHVTSATAAGGMNYGWRCREGAHDNPNPSISCTPDGGGTYTDPIFEYNHNPVTGGISITGGYVYRGTNPANAALAGYYVCADYGSGNVWMVKPDGSFTRQSGLPNNVTSFGEDNAGELYTVAGSTLYRVFVSGVLPVTLARFTGEAFQGYNELRWTTSFEENIQKFSVEYALNGNDFVVVGEVPAMQSSTGSNYSFKHIIPNAGLISYRLRMVDIDQKSNYSAIITLGNRNNIETRIYPTVITNQTIQVISGFSADKMEIFNADGKQVFVKSLNGISGYFRVLLPALQKGMYIVRLAGKEEQRMEKIFIQ